MVKEEHANESMHIGDCRLVVVELGHSCIMIYIGVKINTLPSFTIIR